VLLAPVTLHTGVSSQEAGEPPQPERFRVPASTAAVVNHVRDRGGRVVAVGTTVTRALETAAVDGEVRATSGWTDLVLGPSRTTQVVDGLVTGWHESGASHLDLLEAVAGRALVRAAYDEAHRLDLLWHEFGDSCLLLP
jgi:S-adenosylmethionine:tRNA ribosyltransferase-isomerase